MHAKKIFSINTRNSLNEHVCNRIKSYTIYFFVSRSEKFLPVRNIFAEKTWEPRREKRIKSERERKKKDSELVRYFAFGDDDMCRFVREIVKSAVAREVSKFNELARRTGRGGRELSASNNSSAWYNRVVFIFTGKPTYVPVTIRNERQTNRAGIARYATFPGDTKWIDTSRAPMYKRATRVTSRVLFFFNFTNGSFANDRSRNEKVYIYTGLRVSSVFISIRGLLTT